MLVSVACTPGMARIVLISRSKASSVSSRSSATRSQRPLTECSVTTLTWPRSWRITASSRLLSTARLMIARIWCTSSSGFRRSVYPTITPSCSSRAIRFCTVARATRSFLASATTGIRAFSRNSAISCLSRSFILYSRRLPACFPHSLQRATRQNRRHGRFRNSAFFPRCWRDFPTSAPHRDNPECALQHWHYAYPHLSK